MIDVWGTGYNALERFDLLNDALELSYPIDCLIFVDDRGREIATFGNDLIHRIFGDRFFCIQRGDLARVFHNALGTQVEVLYSTSIDLLCDTEEGIYVSLSGSRFRKYDLVIGADGQHSRIRELVFGPEQEFEKHLRYYAASFITANYPHRNRNAYVSHACPRSAKLAVMHCETVVLRFYWFLLSRISSTLIGIARFRKRTLCEAGSGTTPGRRT